MTKMVVKKGGPASEREFEAPVVNTVSDSLQLEPLIKDYVERHRHIPSATLFATMPVIDVNTTTLRQVLMAQPLTLSYLAPCSATFTLSTLHAEMGCLHAEIKAQGNEVSRLSMHIDNLY